MVELSNLEYDITYADKMYHVEVKNVFQDGDAALRAYEIAVHERLGFRYNPFKSLFHKVPTQTKPIMRVNNLRVDQPLEMLLLDIERRLDLSPGEKHGELVAFLRPMHEQYVKKR